MENVLDHISPVPKRFWWLKRIAVLAALVLVALICLRFWWGVESHRRLQAEIDRIKAAGQPLFLEDFVPPPVSDEDNAAILIRQAVANWNDAAKEAEDDRQYLQDNAEPLSMVREATSRPGCDWGIAFTSPAINILLPHLSSQRRLGRALADVAKRQHRLGDDAAAIETLRDLMTVADMLEKPPPTLVNHLVAVSIRAWAIDVIETITPGLRVSCAGTVGDRLSQPTTRRQVTALITHLLDEDAMRDDLVAAYYAERAQQLGTARLISPDHS